MTEVLVPLEPAAWAFAPSDDEVDQELVCTNVIAVTHDVKTFVLEPAEPRTFRFDPGQYVTLMVSIEGRQVSRCYTISSPPTRPHQLAITVKRVPGGLVSNWLHDQLRTGQSVSVTGPLGQFSMARHPAPKYLFLSGGSGITPLMSMTRTVHELADPSDVVFVHNARSPEDIIFRGELEGIAAQDDPVGVSSIRVVPICEEDSPGERWAGLRGRLSPAMLRVIAPDLHEREIFACGPAPYMSAVRDMLAAEGVDPSRYHEESFTFDDLVHVRPSPPDEPVRSCSAAPVFAIEFSRSGRTIECDGDTYILDAALRAGVNVASSCGEGMCGTCKSTLMAGTVDMQHAGGIRPREIAQDKILICCSKPLNNLVIEA